MLDRKDRPLIGFALLSAPIALILAGAGAALLTDDPAPSPMTGIVLLLTGLLLPLPFLGRRTFQFDETEIRVESVLGPFRKETSHRIADFKAVHWEVKHPKPVDAGSSHARTFALRLVGDDTSLWLPQRGIGETEGLPDARAIGAAYGWPVHRLVDGEVVETFPPA